MAVLMYKLRVSIMSLARTQLSNAIVTTSAYIRQAE